MSKVLSTYVLMYTSPINRDMYQGITDEDTIIEALIMAYDDGVRNPRYSAPGPVIYFHVNRTDTLAG